MPPAAISPEAKREPGEISLSVDSPPVFLTAASTNQRTMPPTKMAKVVPMER